MSTTGSTTSHQPVTLITEAIQVLDAGTDLTFPASKAVDILLDIRLVAADPYILAVIDKAISEVSRRPSLLTSDEVAGIRDTLLASVDECSARS